MGKHARPRSVRFNGRFVALGVVVLLASGTSISYAAAGGGATLHACYKTKGGALSYRIGSHCPAGTKPLAWNAQGPAGPAGVIHAYVGRAHYPPYGKVLPDSDSGTLVAETPKLPAGNYLVNATADVYLLGDTAVSCFVSVVGIHPKRDGHYGAAWDTDAPDIMESSVAIDEAFSGVHAGDRLGFYCSNDGFAKDNDNKTAIASVDLNATPVHTLTLTTVT